MKTLQTAKEHLWQCLWRRKIMKKQKQTRKMDTEESKQKTYESEITTPISPTFPEVSKGERGSIIQAALPTTSTEVSKKEKTEPTIKVSKTTTKNLFPNDKQGYIKLAVIPFSTAIVAKLLSNDMVDRLLARFVTNSIVLQGVKLLILVVFIAILLIVFKCL